MGKTLVYKVKTEQEGIDGIMELESLGNYVTLEINPLKEIVIPYEITIKVDAEHPGDVSEVLETIRGHGTVEVVGVSIQEN